MICSELSEEPFITRRANPCRHSLGSASLFSLFISMVIFTVAIGFNWTVREQNRASVALEEKIEALVLGQSTLNLPLFSVSGEDSE